MSIPKVIHYCWFGRGEKSELMKMCIASWKKYCPDWEIIEWNEDNYDVNFCQYTAKAYRERRWGFLPDAARLDIIYRHGGVYFDTDVELKRPIDELLDNDAWFGYATDTEIGAGVGFGAVKGHPFIMKLLEQYLTWDEKREFTVCTTTDAKVFYNELPGFAGDCRVRQEINGVLLLNNIWDYATHHYTHTWMSKRQKFLRQFEVYNWLARMKGKLVRSMQKLVYRINSQRRK
ncbi:MAG: glycosyl transferase [Clostridia bacterium]|nr:glycosyl transferase [Clostridia bacterium]